MHFIRGCSHALVVDKPEDLRMIHHPEINMVIWKRKVSKKLRQCVNRLPRRFGYHRVIKLNGTLRDAKRQVAKQIRQMPEAGYLIKDVLRMFSLFCQIGKYGRSNAEASAYSGYGANEFHVDEEIKIVLLVSYRYPTTEWLANEEIVRGKTADDFLIYEGYRKKIRRVPLFAVMITKGGSYPGNRRGGFVHREPSTIKIRKDRIVLVAA